MVYIFDILNLDLIFQGLGIKSKVKFTIIWNVCNFVRFAISIFNIFLGSVNTKQGLMLHDSYKKQLLKPT